MKYFYPISLIIFLFLPNDLVFGFTALPNDGYCSCDFEKEAAALSELRLAANINFWSESEPVSNWEGVFLSAAGCVDSIVLISRGVWGSVPTSIFRDLIHLQKIDFSTDPSLHDPIELSMMIPIPLENIEHGPFIEELYADILYEEIPRPERTFNSVRMSIPPDIKNLKSLRYLAINNALSNLPEEFWELENLEYLKISLSNTGIKEIVPKLDRLKNLKTLILSSTSFEILTLEFLEHLTQLESLEIKARLNFIPSTIGKLQSLRKLVLRGDTRIVTEIPDALFDLTNLTHLELTNHAITEISTKISELNKLTVLNISSNPIEKIPEEIGQLTQLKKLNLGNLNLISVLPNTLNNLNKLEELKLNNMELNEFPNISNLLELKVLDLERTFTVIPDEIGSLSNLEVLTMGGAKLTKVSSGIGNLKKLKTLSINFAENLQELPETMSNLTELEELYLNANRLTRLPENIGNLKKLRFLEASENNLIGLPASFNGLERLYCLKLNANDALSLGPEIGGLPQLKFLDLNGCQLSQLPEAIGNLPSLKEFDLLDNQLTELPKGISGLQNLKVLRISNNKLKTLPSSIGQLRELAWLFMENNEVEGFPEEIGGLTNLRWLYGNNNQLNYIPESIAGLTKLRRLSLLENRLERVSPGIIALNGLNRLYLSHNLIAEIPFEISRMSNLETLYVDNNRLTMVASEALSSLTKLTFIELQENDLDTLELISISNPEVLHITNNRLSFDDILPFKERYPENFGPLRYNPQKEIPYPSPYLTPCDSILAFPDFESNLPGGSYELIKRDEIIFSTDSRDSINLYDFFASYPDLEGSYQWRIFNNAIPDLTLRSEEFSVLIDTIEIVAVEDTLCFDGFVTYNDVIYDINNPKGCEIALDENSGQEKSFAIDLRFFQTDTVVQTNLCLGKTYKVNGMDYDCTNNPGMISFKSALTGCDSTVTLKLSCDVCEDFSQIPRAFRPGSDDPEVANFTIPQIFIDPGNFGENELYVYNRFRQEVFYQKNYNNDWKGTDPSGAPLPAGTYFYSFQPLTGKVLNGTISIVR